METPASVVIEAVNDFMSGVDFGGTDSSSTHFDNFDQNLSVARDISPEEELEAITEEFDLFVMRTAKMRGQMSTIIKMLSEIEDDQDQFELFRSDDIEMIDTEFVVEEDCQNDEENETLSESTENGAMLHVMHRVKDLGLYDALVESVFTEDEFDFFAKQYNDRTSHLQQNLFD